MWSPGSKLTRWFAGVRAASRFEGWLFWSFPRDDGVTEEVAMHRCLGCSQEERDSSARYAVALLLILAELCVHRCPADVAAALNCVLTGALQMSLRLPTGWTCPRPSSTTTRDQSDPLAADHRFRLSCGGDCCLPACCHASRSLAVLASGCSSVSCPVHLSACLLACLTVRLYGSLPIK